MSMNINQQIIRLSIHKTPDSELKVTVFDEVYALILQSAVVFPA